MNCKANILLLSILCIFSTSCNNRGASTPQQINSSLFVGYEKLIGKSFLDISELDTNLHWSEGSVLPEADQYSMSRFSINNKNNIDLIFLIQQVEDRNKILDILTIDEKTFSQ